MDSGHADFTHQLHQRLSALNRYENLSPVLKTRRRSFSCSKLPPLNSADRGSPVLSSASTRASSTASMRSQSKSSSGVSLHSAGRDSPPERSSSKTSRRSRSKASDCMSSPESASSGKSPTSAQQTSQQSRRSAQCTQTSEWELFPKLPNSFTDALFVSRRHGSGQKASSKKASIVTSHNQAMSEKRPQKASTTVHNTLAPLLEQHHTIRLLHERNTIAASSESDDSNASVLGNGNISTCHKNDTSHKDYPHVHVITKEDNESVLNNTLKDDRCSDDVSHGDIPGKVCSCDKKSWQSLPEPVHPCHGVVDTEKEGPKGFDCDDTCSTKSSADCPRFDSEKPVLDSPARERTMLGFQNPQSCDIGDDNFPLRTFEALVSPLRDVRGRKMLPRALFRGQTVGIRGQPGANCLPDQKLQDVTSAFIEYDVDSNGKLSGSELIKLLKDQGVSLDSTDINDAVALVLPEGSSALLSSPNGVDLAAFTELVAHGVRAEALREEQYRGYSKEQADVLQNVFDAYDANHSGVLEASELGHLLEDIGQAPSTFSEQEELHSALKRILGGSLRPLQFRDFLEFAKILEATSIGSGGRDQNEKPTENRRSSDLDMMQIARRAGLRMADVVQLQDIFSSDAKNGMLSSAELYDLLKSRLRLKTAEGEREMQVHSTIERYAGSAGSLDFEDFLNIIGDLVDAKLATVSSVLGRQERSTDHFLGHLATLLE